MSTAVSNMPSAADGDRARKQLRGFAIIWLGVTLLTGACVFTALYWAIGQTDLEALMLAPTDTPTPSPSPTVAAQSVLPTATPIGIEPTPGDTPTPAPTPTLLPREDRSFGYGIQVQESYDIQDHWMMVVAEQLGLNWIKQQVRWELMEPEPGQYDWTVLDIVLPRAQEYGLKVLLSIVTAPEWARPAGVDPNSVGPPEDYNDYVNFVRAILERYPGQVHAIEVWNEQNLQREWNTPEGLSAARYVELLAMTEEAVHSIDPGIIVVSGALSPTGVGPPIALDDFVYFDQMIAAGLLNYADCVGAHHNGYNIGPSERWDNVTSPRPEHFTGPWDNPHHSWSFRSTLETYYDKIVSAGGDQPLCVTEFGWATVEDMDGYPPGFEFALDNTLEEQAEWIVEAFQWLSEWEGCWLAFLWNLNYGPQSGDPTNDNAAYSIIDLNGIPRPAFGAIAAMPKD